MLNKPIRLFFWIYLALMIVVLVFCFGHRQQMSDVFYPLLILSVVMYILGLIIGLVTCILLRTPQREPMFYLIGQILPLFVLFSGVGYVFYDNFHKPYSRKNRERTEGLDPVVAMTYSKLQSSFVSPNDFLFHTYACYGNISKKNIEPDTTYTVYLEYNLKENPKLTYYSRYRVHHNEVELLESRIPADSSEEYQHIEHSRKAINKTFDKLETLRDGRDSVSGTIK